MGEILTGKMKTETIKSRVQEELDSKQIWNVEDLLITDCYYALKHIEEEHISLREWEYFYECLTGARNYELEEKEHYIIKSVESSAEEPDPDNGVLPLR